MLGLRSSEDYLLWHRGLTHSLTGLLIYPPVFALLASGLAPRLSFARALLLLEIAFLSHIALDLPTAWGTLVLYPWNHARYALDWIFIMDPVLWALFAGGVLGGMRATPERRWRAARVSLALACLYVLAAGGLHARAVAVTRAAAETAGRAAESSGREVPPLAAAVQDAVQDVEVYPLPLSPFSWHGVAWRGERLVHVWLEGVPARVRGTEAEPHGLGDPAARDALMSRPGQAFLWWARAPALRVLRAEEDRTVVGFGDRRFYRRGRSFFGLEVTTGPDGELLEAVWE